MINRTVPRRYAQALLMIAHEKNALELYEQELEGFGRRLLEDPQLKSLMDNPRVQPEEKRKYLGRHLQGQVDPIIFNFLNLIVDKRREYLFLEIIHEYKQYADQARNITDAEVRSAVQLTDKDFRELRERLCKATGKNVRLQSRIDTTLIGGMVVQIGDTVIDGSVAKKLSLLRKRLRESQFEGIGVNK